MSNQTESTALVKREEILANMHAGGRGIEIRSMPDLIEMAKAFAASGFCPKGVSSLAQAMIAIQAGLEVGLQPFAAIQSFAVINGRPSLFGAAAMGVLRASGKSARWTETVTETSAKVESKRVNGDTQSATFTVDDAKKAGLWNKSGPWSQYPKIMMLWRARSQVLRGLYADVLMGLPLTEEIRDIEVETTVAKYPPPKLEPKTRKRKAKPEPEPEPELDPEIEAMASELQQLIEREKIGVERVAEFAKEFGLVERVDYVQISEFPPAAIKKLHASQAGLLLAMRQGEDDEVPM
jgi:hypothetical protein